MFDAFMKKKQKEDEARLSGSMLGLSLRPSLVDEKEEKQNTKDSTIWAKVDQRSSQ
eukprot:gene1936-12931_t